MLATKMHCREGFSSRRSLSSGHSHHGTNQIPGVRAASRVAGKRRVCPTVAFIGTNKEPAVPAVVVPLGVSRLFYVEADWDQYTCPLFLCSILVRFFTALSRRRSAASRFFLKAFAC